MSIGPPPGPAGEIPALRAPEPTRLFDARAARFAALADGHAVPGWLALLSRVARGQAAAVRAVRAERPPSPPVGPPLDVAALPRDRTWQRMLAAILAAARDPDLPAAADEALRLLAAAAPDALEALADGVLSGETRADRLACAPFVGAALQAWWCALAADLDPEGAPRGGPSCPACGGPPVAGLVGGSDRLRYVTCALCCSEWNVPRVKCVSCDTAAGPTYLQVDELDGVKAEACPACRSYVKLFDLLRRPAADAAADDAATVALDVILAREGWNRAGANLYVGTGA